jgi:hypothetical protein
MSFVPSEEILTMLFTVLPSRESTYDSYEKLRKLMKHNYVSHRDGGGFDGAFIARVIRESAGLAALVHN